MTAELHRMHPVKARDHHLGTLLLRQQKVAHHSKMVAAVTDAHPAQAAGQHHLRGGQHMQWRDLRVLTPCLRTPQQLRCLSTGKDIGLIKMQS